jgi:hypothetical protein
MGHTHPTGPFCGLMEGATWGSVRLLEVKLRALLSRSLNFMIPDPEGDGKGWQPYAPGIFRMFGVSRQIGYRPPLYVMRAHDGKRWVYRECSESELYVIKSHGLRLPTI